MTPPGAGSMQEPPGWYPDPDSPSLRWWDGIQWSDRWAPASNRPNGATTSKATQFASPSPANSRHWQAASYSSAQANSQSTSKTATAPKKKQFTVLWVAGLIFVVGLFGSILANNSSDNSTNEATKTVEGPTDPQSLASALPTVRDTSFGDLSSYRTLDESEFKKIMHPSGDLVEYPYPYVGSRVVLYGKVDELPSEYETSTGGTYFDATVSWHDLGPIVSWSLNSVDVPIIGLRSDLGDVEPGSNLAIYVEVRRPFLTGAKVFDSALRDPFLVAHSVRVIR
ncbi:DUF2510 domain-containing protein [Rhodococcus erythropolis]|uniref:DUF2510 domain-containing protein n=1 Tax=Rhodococcus erythropolis TaxID=1833 RepID=UPI003D1315CB